MPRTWGTEMAINIEKQLEAIATYDDFVSRCYELTDIWKAAQLGAESIEPILKFMEKHPLIDFGARGPLVHFVEQFDDGIYEEKLLDSIRRKPTVHTIGMLNAVINGTQDMEKKLRLVAEMDSARRHRFVDECTLAEINRLLARLIE